MTLPAQDPAAPPLSAQADRWQLAFGLLVTFLVALAIWPLWAGKWLPLHDAAQVQHQASVIWDWHVEAVFRRDFERLTIPTPNFLGIALLTVLARLGGVAIAHKLLLSLCIVSVVAATAWLLHQARQPRWLLIAVLPWVWHHEMFVGHLAHTLGLPIFVALLAAHLGLLRQFGPWRALLVAALVVALAVTHLLLWLCGALMLPLLGMAMGRGWRGVLRGLGRDALVVLPSVAVLGPWYRREVLAEGGFANFSAEWALPVSSLRAFFGHMFDVFAPRGTALESLADLLFNRPGDVISGVWLAGLGLWWLAGVRAMRAQPGVPPTLELRYLQWALLLGLLGFFALPTHLFRPIWVHGLAPRLASVVAILAVVALPFDPVRPPRTARMRAWLGGVCALIAATWLPLAALRSTVLIQPEFDHLDEALAAIPRSKAVLVLRPKYESHWMQIHIFADVGQWAAVLRGAAVPHGFIDPVLQPVRLVAKNLRPTPPGDDHDRFNWTEHGRYYDYVAVFRDPFGPEPRYLALLRSWPEVYHRGKWQVFHNEHPEPFPPPPPPPLPPRDPDRQVTESLMQALGPMLGFGWQPSYELELAASARGERIRTALGWPSRHPEVLPEPIAVPPPVSATQDAAPTPMLARPPMPVFAPAPSPLGRPDMQWMGRPLPPAEAPVRPGNEMLH